MEPCRRHCHTEVMAAAWRGCFAVAVLRFRSLAKPAGKPQPAHTQMPRMISRALQSCPWAPISGLAARQTLSCDLVFLFGTLRYAVFVPAPDPPAFLCTRHVSTTPCMPQLLLLRGRVSKVKRFLEGETQWRRFKQLSGSTPGILLRSSCFK